MSIFQRYFCSRPLTVCVALALPLLFATCQSAATEVNIYSGRQEALIKPLLDKFTEQTGVKVNLVTGNADALLSRIKAEGQYTAADLVILADVGRLVRAKNMGLTQALSKTDVLDIAGANWHDEQGHWVALTKRARPIMVKKGSFDPSTLTQLSQLTDAKFANSICIRSSDNIYNQSMVSALIEIWGTEKTQTWAQGFVNNFARSPKGGDRDQIKALVAGECSIAIANTYYLGGMLSSKDEDEQKIAQQVAVLWNDQGPESDKMGVHINVSGAAITQHAKNVENANKVLTFMLTESAQQWYAEVNHEYPIIDGVALSPELESFGDFKAQQVSLEKVGENNAEALMLMDRAGWK